MTEIKLIFRFNVSEVVFPSVEQLIKSDINLNIISENRIRNEFLKSENEIADKINYFDNENKVIPTEYWCPFWTALVVEDGVNVFTSMVGNIDKFKEFEACLKSKNFILSEIVYLKVNDIPKLVELAKQKYSKIYNNSEILQKRINKYNEMRDAITDYAKTKYKVTESDFFVTEINI